MKCRVPNFKLQAQGLIIQEGEALFLVWTAPQLNCLVYYQGCHQQVV